ncbi:MAG: hypothetical protein J6S14_06460 [Clostridia bacterium]|nr:hypothetical protein [Clostridia bacterium]
MKTKVLKILVFVLAMIIILCTLSACGEATPGPQGVQGEKGEKGEKGDKGEAGATIAKIEFDDQGNLVITLTDGTVLDPVEFPKKEEDPIDEELWVASFPKPKGKGITLYNTMDNTDNSLQWLYTGEGVTVSAYQDYCQRLLKAGYRVLMQNTIEDSLFTTFVNDSEGISLYVAYNAYKYKELVLPSNDAENEAEEYGYDACLRIVASTLNDVTLPNEDLLNENPIYEKVTDSMVTTTPLHVIAVGLSYIITLEDGRFIIFDGGGVSDNNIEHDVLWNALRNLYVKIYGKTPTTEDPIHIAAWILTHNHWDHCYAFQCMLQKYGQSGLVKMDYMFANLPNENGAKNCIKDLYTIDKDAINDMKSNIIGGFEYITVHTGQKYYLANLEIEVLCTWEDLNPICSSDSNDTNTVVRFTLTNKDNVDQKVTQMWLGDAASYQSRFLCAMYGNYLKSDMTSVAHHGDRGCETNLYDLILPTAVWWPNHANSVSKYLKPTNREAGAEYEVDQHLIYDIDTVKYMYVSGNKYTSSNNYTAYYVTLILTKHGPDYDGVFDLCGNTSMEYCDIEDFYLPENDYVIAKK